VTFIVQASRGEDVTTTIRLSVVVAIAKALALAEGGWQFSSSGPTASITIRPSSRSCCRLAPQFNPASDSMQP